jgi:cellulose synthase (UDP-forming)
VVVVPTAPRVKEIELLLYLMSHFGTQTGYPALRVEVSGPETVMRGDRDYLLLGGTSDQPAFASLDAALPVTYDRDGVHVKQETGVLESLRGYLRKINREADAGAELSNVEGVPDVLLEGLESPFFAGRSIVLLAVGNDQAVDEFADVFLERSQSSDIEHSVSLLRNGKFSSYAIDAREYHVGNIAPYPLLRLWLAEHFWLLLAVVTLLSLVVASYARDYLVLLAEDRVRVDSRS